VRRAGPRQGYTSVMALRLSRLAPPPAAGDPRDTLRYVRAVEIFIAVVSFVFAIELTGWPRWALVATGLLSLSPWPGARSILRRADRDPDVLVSDADRRRARGRRVVLVLVPLYALGGAGFGYVIGGWSAALLVGVLIGGGAVAGGWLTMRSLRP
jgi:hypothetical protein